MFLKSMAHRASRALELHFKAQHARSLRSAALLHEQALKEQMMLAAAQGNYIKAGKFQAALHEILTFEKYGEKERERERQRDREMERARERDDAEEAATKKQEEAEAKAKAKAEASSTCAAAAARKEEEEERAGVSEREQYWRALKDWASLPSVVTWADVCGASIIRPHLCPRIIPAVQVEGPHAEPHTEAPQLVQGLANSTPYYAQAREMHELTHDVEISSPRLPTLITNRPGTSSLATGASAASPGPPLPSPLVSRVAAEAEEAVSEAEAEKATHKPAAGNNKEEKQERGDVANKFPSALSAPPLAPPVLQFSLALVDLEHKRGERGGRQVISDGVISSCHMKRAWEVGDVGKTVEQREYDSARVSRLLTRARSLRLTSPELSDTE